MKKMTLAALAVLLNAAPLAAIDLNFHAGYTTLAMRDLNRMNDAIYGYEGVGRSDHLDNGMVLGLDATTPLEAAPWLALGLRGEWLHSNQGRMDQDYDDQHVHDLASLTSLLFGGKAQEPFLIDGLQLGLSAWLGYGFATLYQDASDPNQVLQSGLFMGSLMVGELEGSLTYALGPQVSVAFSGGWRWASAGPLYDDQHKPLVDGAQALRNQPAGPVDIDFSGATARASISLHF
jgi:hypothetical protein